MPTAPIAPVLAQNLQKLQKYLLTNQIEAFRLYNNDNRIWPLAIDIYKDSAVIHIFWALKTLEMAKLSAEIERSLVQLLQIKSFFYKNRTKEPKLQLPRSSSPKTITINEYGHQFAINLSDYLDTGLFLDHRETRKWIGEQSKGKIVLNTFAYTGSFSIYAAKNGAQKTYSVDLSKTYCDWIKQNLTLNGLSEEQNWIYKMDTMEFFAYAQRKNMLFDIIVIDPPTFSRNKGARFSIQQDHPALINAALKVLSPTGLILFSNNYQDFRLKKAELVPCNVVSKTDTFPPDFAGSHPHHCFVITKLK